MRPAVWIFVGSVLTACAGRAEYSGDGMSDAAGERRPSWGDLGARADRGTPKDSDFVDGDGSLASGDADVAADLAPGAECVPRCGNKCAGQSNGCGGTCPDNTCSGCCDATNTCRSPSAGACGVDGAACVRCESGLSCVSGTCACVPSCSGKCLGEADGCGGTCASSAGCSGCCDTAGKCQPGTADLLCGAGGTSCTDCAATGDTCNGGSCHCTASCVGKCAGQDNGCGKPCPMNHCSGCCDGNAVCQPGSDDLSCGRNGASCVDCTALGQACDLGACG